MPTHSSGFDSYNSVSRSGASVVASRVKKGMLHVARLGSISPAKLGSGGTRCKDHDGSWSASARCHGAWKRWEISNKVDFVDAVY